MKNTGKLSYLLKRCQDCPRGHQEKKRENFGEFCIQYDFLISLFNYRVSHSFIHWKQAFQNGHLFSSLDSQIVKNSILFRGIQYIEIWGFILQK